MKKYIYSTEIRFRFIFINIMEKNTMNYAFIVGILLFTYNNLSGSFYDRMEAYAQMNNEERRNYDFRSAILNNNVDLVIADIRDGVDVNQISNGESILHTAARKGNPIIVQALIDAGADVNWKNEYNTSALDIVIQLGSAYDPVISVLLESGKLDYELIFDTLRKTENKCAQRLMFLQESGLQLDLDYERIIDRYYKVIYMLQDYLNPGLK